MSFLKNYYTAKAAANLATNTAPKGLDIGFGVSALVVCWAVRAVYRMAVGAPAYWADAWANFDAGQWVCVGLPVALGAAIAWDQLKRTPKK